MKRILLTGATGFVGANLLKALLDVNPVDIVIRKNSNLWRIENLLSSIHKVWHADLTDRNEIYKIIHQAQPSVIYHIATYGGSPSQKNPISTIETNLQGTVNLVDAALKCHVDYFINTGSSSEYGMKMEPMHEDDSCNPLSLYGVTKLAATNYCSMIGKKEKLKICTLRLFSPYGLLEDPARLYPSIVNSLNQNQPPKLTNPNYVRDFIEIEKVVDIYKKIVDVSFEQGGIYNVGSGKQQTIREFYNKISKKLYKNIEPIWTLELGREIEPIFWEADISKLSSLFA